MPLQAMVAKVVRAIEYAYEGLCRLLTIQAGAVITVSQPEFGELVRFQIAHRSHSSGRAPSCSSTISTFYRNN